MSGSFDPCELPVDPSNKKSFVNWLSSLKEDDLITNKFNGFMYDKTYKSIKDLYYEWFFGKRIDEANERIKRNIENPERIPEDC